MQLPEPVQDGAVHRSQDDVLCRLLEPLRWRCLDGEWLVFGAASGALLRPDALGAAILSLLEESPLLLSAIVLRIAEDTEIAATPALHLRIAGIVDGLQRADLLQCRPS